ncbi:MAG: Sensor protein [uncultured bacterium]|nr:MAG: Sensor protein [uncultured bacterium]
MNTKSIHFKITFFFSLFLFIATGIIFSSFYIVTSRILFKEVDKELLLHSHNPSLFNDVPGMVITILDQNGIIKQSSISLDTPYMSYRYLYDTAVKSSQESYVNQNIGNTPMRFMVKPVIIDGELSEVLLIAHPIEAIQKSLNILLSTLGIFFALFILPTILGARLLALKILKPISVIADRMDDITSVNLNERLETSKTNDVIEKLTTTFNNLLDRLEQSFTRERQFIGDVAHELKTPIATLKSGIEVVLSKERQKQEYQNALTETLIDTDRLSLLVGNIMDLAWIGANKNTTNYEKFSLSDALKELKEISIKLATKKQIRIKSSIFPNIEMVGDESKIIRAILNIVDNAIKYTKNKGIVSVSLRKRKNKVVVTVSDNGIGISATDLDYIFERFYRGSKTAKTVGSGLGLAIASGIIKAYNGDIKIESQIGKGTIVKITLPL